MNNDKQIKPLFGIWCQKILPLVYDESLSYYEVLCKVQSKLNEVIDSQNNLENEFYQLKDWIDSQLETYSKEQFQEWLDDGTINELLKNKNIEFFSTTSELLTSNPTKGKLYITNGYFQNEDGGKASFMVEDVQPDTPYIKINETTFLKYLPQESYDLIAFGLNSNDDITVRFNEIVQWLGDNHIILYITHDYGIDLNIGLSVKSNCTIIGDGTHILAGKTPYNLTNYNMLQIHNCNNVIIKNLRLNGVKDGNLSETGEWGHCIQIIDSKNIKIEKCELYNAFGDGIELGSGQELLIEPTIEISYCDIHDCRRQGISVLSGENIYIHDCFIHEVSGTEPKSAIDIEPWFDKQKVENVLIENLKIDNCYRGILITGIGNDTENVFNCNIHINNVSVYNTSGDSLGLGVSINNIDGNVNCNVLVENLSCYDLFFGMLSSANVNKNKCTIIVDNARCLDCGNKYTGSEVEAKPIIFNWADIKFLHGYLMGNITLKKISINYTDESSRPQRDIIFMTTVSNTNYAFDNVYIECNTENIWGGNHMVNSKILSPTHYYKDQTISFSEIRYNTVAFLTHSDSVILNLTNIPNVGYPNGLKFKYIIRSPKVTINSTLLYPRTSQIGSNGTKIESNADGSIISMHWDNVRWVIDEIVGNWTAF